MSNLVKKRDLLKKANLKKLRAIDILGTQPDVTGVEICKELDIKIIPCIITQIGNPKFFLKGRELKTDKEIKELFFLPEEVEIRRTKQGWIDQINIKKFLTIRNKYEKKR